MDILRCTVAVASQKTDRNLAPGRRRSDGLDDGRELHSRHGPEAPSNRENCFLKFLRVGMFCGCWFFSMTYCTYKQQKKHSKVVLLMVEES